MPNVAVRVLANINGNINSTQVANIRERAKEFQKHLEDVGLNGIIDFSPVENDVSPLEQAQAEALRLRKMEPPAQKLDAEKREAEKRDTEKRGVKKEDDK